VRLVLVPVTVLGAPDHRFTAGDFEVFDDGHKQHVAVFDSDFSSPISRVVANDTSLSTATHLEQEKNAALEIINAVGPQDALELVNFNHIVAAETSFTNDRAVLAHAVHALRPSGATSLYDAIYLASDELGRRTGRKALIIISDGGDTTSSVTFQRALREAIGADVVIYSVVVVPIESDAGRDIGGEHALQYLSEQTGGQTFAADPAHLSQPVERVLGALRREYLIGFYPKLNSKDDSAGVHQIRVETKYTGLTLLSRKRYYED
jgi:Ca-activated chloride channel family protein